MDKEKNRNEKRKLRLVEKYDNDDYTRFASQDYSEPFEVGQEDFLESHHQDKQNIELRPQGNWHHPGVSGKVDGKTWVNQEEYKSQVDFVGRGPKNYKRSDDRIYEDACEALMKSPHVDASNIGVKIDKGIITLSGKVETRKMKRDAEICVESLSGVRDVKNELSVLRRENNFKGPDAATKKDLGI